MDFVLPLKEGQVGAVSQVEDQMVQGLISRAEVEAR